MNRAPTSTSQQTPRVALQHCHALLCNSMVGLPDATVRSRYASLILHRLLFLTFLQRTGMLERDDHFLQRELQRFPPDSGEFYSEILRSLFHGPESTLALDFRAFFSACEFDLHYPDLVIANATFHEIFTCFDLFLSPRNLSRKRRDQFTPDLLGSLFEQDDGRKA